jgi:hypothetical protein
MLMQPLSPAHSFCVRRIQRLNLIKFAKFSKMAPQKLENLDEIRSNLPFYTPSIDFEINFEWSINFERSDLRNTNT